MYTTIEAEVGILCIFIEWLPFKNFSLKGQEPFVFNCLFAIHQKEKENQGNDELRYILRKQKRNGVKTKIISCACGNTTRAFFKRTD